MMVVLEPTRVAFPSPQAVKGGQCRAKPRSNRSQAQAAHSYPGYHQQSLAATLRGVQSMRFLHKRWCSLISPYPCEMYLYVLKVSRGASSTLASPTLQTEASHTPPSIETDVIAHLSCLFVDFADTTMDTLIAPMTPSPTAAVSSSARTRRSARSQSLQKLEGYLRITTLRPHGFVFVCREGPETTSQSGEATVPTSFPEIFFVCAVFPALTVSRCLRETRGSLG